MDEKMENVIREMASIKRNQMKILKLKNTVFETKN